MTTATDQRMKVFYDGACPLCRREIGFYQRRKGADAIDWIDISQIGNDPVAPGLSHEDAKGRFHVMDDDGRLLNGGAAFAAVWRGLPGFRFIGRIMSLPGFDWALDKAYDGFLLIRPRLQRLAGGKAAGNQS